MGSPKSQEIIPAREPVKRVRGSKTARATSSALANPCVEVRCCGLGTASVDRTSGAPDHGRSRKANARVHVSSEAAEDPVILQEPSVLDDESVWGIQVVDRVNSGIWLESDDVMVKRTNEDPNYPYGL
jgi:hypothetical protein